MSTTKPTEIDYEELLRDYEPTHIRRGVEARNQRFRELLKERAVHLDEEVSENTPEPG